MAMSFKMVDVVRLFWIAGDLEQTIRSEMERNRYEKNQQTIRFLISDGLQRLKQLNVMLGIQGYEEA
jgi:hypothetical protein